MDATAKLFITERRLSGSVPGTTRRALAHVGTLTDTDVERMEVNVPEWLRDVG